MSRPPRDPKEIVRELDATMKARDLREWAKLRGAVAPTVGEMSYLAALFAFVLGLILTLIFVLPQENEGVYLLWVLWGGGTAITAFLTLEFLVRKFRIVRRMVELQARRVERLEKEVQRLKKDQAREKGDEEENEEN